MRGLRLTRLVCTLAAAAGVVAFATGCKETVEGRYLDTEGIALVAQVTAYNDRESELEVDFLVGGDESNTYVDLSDDEVRASADGMSQRIRPQSRGEYETTFDVAEGGTEFTIELDRSDADKTDADGTSGTLPEPFSVAVEPSGEISRQEAITVTWDVSGDAAEVRIDLDGDCIFYTFEDTEDDDGEFTIPARDLIFGNPDEDDEGDCDVEVTVTRTRRGSVDSVFDGESRFELRQVRSTTYRSIP